MGYTYRLISKNVDDADKRVTDSTDGKEFVVAHNETEQAIGNIFGIVDKQAITSPIFQAVDSDGGIQLIRFKTQSIASSPEDAVGFEFRDGQTVHRFSYVGSRFSTWAKDSDGEWTQQFELESTDDEGNPIEPTLLSKEDVRITAYSPGKVVGVEKPAIDGEYKFTLYNTNVLTDGYVEAAEMDDCDFVINSNSVSKMMAVNNDEVNPLFVLTPQPEDRSEYGIYLSDAREVMADGQLVTMQSFAELNNLGGAAPYNNDIDINSVNIGSVNITDGLFSLNKGFWEVRVRLTVHARENQYGALGISLSRISGTLKFLNARSTQVIPRRLEAPARCQYFHVLIQDDGSEFAVNVALSDKATGTMSVSAAVELERMN